MEDEAVAGSQVAFLPWLRLRSVQTVGGVSFVPLVDGDGKESAELSGVRDSLRTILGSYVDRA